MLRSDDAVYSTSGVELADYLHPLGLARFYKVVEDAINNIFVENAFVAVFLQIELETFQFDTEFIGDVFYFYCAEIGLTCPWTDRCKLRRNMLDGIIPVRVRIIKCFNFAHIKERLH